MRIIPAILEQTSHSFQYQLRRLTTFFGRIHIDIVDGVYTNTTTISLSEIIQSLPHHEGTTPITFDLHLMVRDYKTHIQTLITTREVLQKHNYTIRTVFIHADLHPQLDLIHQSDISVGLVLSPQDTVQTITTHHSLAQVSHIIVMTVNPGGQSNPFIPSALEKIAQLRNADFRGSIYIDGGVNGSTIPTIQSLPHQPDYVCVGSYFTHSNDLPVAVETLQDLIS